MYDEEVRLGTGERPRSRSSTTEGSPLGIDKTLRLAQTFETRSAEHVAPLLDSIEEVLAALRRPASSPSSPTAPCSARSAAAG